MKAGKGSRFERDLCRQFSEWFSGGKATDWFWRSSTSGARATTRSKKGQRTYGQHGDMAATHPKGQPLVDLISFEFKRGYNKTTIFDILDKPKSAAKQKWEEFFDQAIKSHESEGTYSWMIVAQRDRREPLVYMNCFLCDILEIESRLSPCAFLSYWRRGTYTMIVALPLDDFFRTVQPSHILKLAEQC